MSRPDVRYFPLFCLAAMHGLVDSFAMLPEPLYPSLAQKLQLSERGLLILFAVKLLAPNFSQGVFGFLRDRFDLRQLLWIGPVIAVAGLAAIGLGDTLPFVALALGLGMTGVGAFHPEAAVLAGRVCPEQRTRGIAIFMFGGTIGLGAGPLVGGIMAKRYGMESLIWLIPAGAVMAVVLYLLARRELPAMPRLADRRALGWKEALGGRTGLAFYLLIVGAFRVVPNIGLPGAIAFTLAAKGGDTQLIGMTQSLFLVSGSLGMLLMATRWLHGCERACLVWAPLLGVPLLIGLGWQGLPYPAQLALLVLCGLIFNGTTPAMVSYGHQLFPKGAGIASAITMGVSWGISGIMVAGLTSWLVSIGHPEWLYGAFVPCLLLSGWGAWFFPEPARERMSKESLSAAGMPSDRDAAPPKKGTSPEKPRETVPSAPLSAAAGNLGQSEP